MFESFIIDQPTPDVWVLKKTRLTRAGWLVMVILSLLFILSHVFKANITWPQIKMLMDELVKIAGSWEIDKLNHFPSVTKFLLGNVALVLVLFPILVWTIIRLLREQTFSFDSRKRAIAKNGRVIAEFDDIKMLKITMSSSLQAPPVYNLSLFLKKEKGLFSHRINIGTSFKWKEATGIAFQLADIIHVDVIQRRLFSEKTLYQT